MIHILEWIQELPQPHLSKATENYNPSHTSEGYYFDDFTKAMENAFDWEASIEGKTYWQDVVEESVASGISDIGLFLRHRSGDMIYTLKIKHDHVEGAMNLISGALQSNGIECNVVVKDISSKTQGK